MFFEKFLEFAGDSQSAVDSNGKELVSRPGLSSLHPET
jgi:hypothetical protein